MISEDTSERRKNSRVNFWTYSKYFVVGGFIGIFGIGLRELIARMLPEDDPIYYSASVMLTYALLVFVSFFTHRKITFVDFVPVKSTTHSLVRFIATGLIGLGSVTILSNIIRYGLPLELVFGEYSGGTAFAAAAILTSILTFLLNAFFTFKPKV